MPPKRRGRASRKVVGDSRALVSAVGRDVPQPSASVRHRETQFSALLPFSSAINRVVDFAESFVVRRPQVQQSVGQSVNSVPSRTSSSPPSVAPPSSSRQSFRPRGKKFKRSGLSSSYSSGTSGASSGAAFCGQCGGKHRLSQCIGVRGACNWCGQVGNFARVCPVMGQQPNLLQQGSTRSSLRRPYLPFQLQRSGFELPEASRFRDLSLSQQPGLQQTQVDAMTEEQADVTMEEFLQVLLVEPLGSLVFLVRVRQLRGRRAVRAQPAWGRLLLVDFAFSARLCEEATRVSQRFGMLTINFSRCVCEERSADGLRAADRYDDVGVTYYLLLISRRENASVEKRRRIKEFQVTKLDRVEVQLVDPRIPESQFTYDM
ncbi:hypothetical protein F511_10816 [Dorcoceras hygrometricum]|uniref:CCHC-type domain-containing protein n=1 Tax=Dorcoceras hygrometricum TaxID=472368 RepID=A0A2Z7B9E0_9LAMI|nr:hypothetical protein F511_10816 [Dorcoceras hygrometricum]